MDQRAYLQDPTRSADRSILEPLTLAEALAQTAARIPDRLAILSGERRLTWSELDAAMRGLAAFLSGRGIVPGDVVGLSLRNTWEYAVAHLAIARLGAVTLPLHVKYGEDELRTTMKRTGTRAAFLEGDVATGGRLERLFARCPSLKTVVTTEATRTDQSPRVFALADLLGMTWDEPKFVEIAPADVFVLAPTSGTESTVPKICMHSHEGLLSNAAQIIRDAKIDENDVMLVAGGYTHLFGKLGLHVAVLSGAALVAIPKFEPAVYIDTYVREGVTLAWAVPAQFVDILAAAPARKRFPKLREVRAAGAAVPPVLAKRLAQIFGVQPVLHWGMSELGAGITTRHGDPAEATGTIGVPLRGADVRVVDADGRPCAPGEVGELHYRRADMFRGYFEEPILTGNAVTADGFLRTGDLAAIGADGRVQFHGRLKDLINRGGMKIGALEVESHLAGMPALRQLAVVRVDDERLGERVALVCSLQPEKTVTLDDVRAYLAERDVAKYKWPEYVLVLGELPVTPSGKIAKEAVRTFAARSIISNTQRTAVLT